MSVFAFYLTDAACLSEVPGPAGNISASSVPVNDAQVSSWREDASGIVESSLESRGIDADSLSDTNIRLAQRAIKTFVAYKVLQAHEDATAASFLVEHQAALAVIREEPELLGDGENIGASIKSNIDTDDPSGRKFLTFNTDRGDGWSGW